MLARRAMLAAALSSSAVLSPVQRASAVTEIPEVTAKVRLGFTLGNSSPRYMTIGLYGEAAPVSVQTFTQLCTGNLEVAPGLGYAGSSVSQIVRDNYIVAGKPAGGDAVGVDRSIDSTGYVRSVMINRADALINNDQNSLSHDRPALVSMTRGGGVFEFTLTPRPNAVRAHLPALVLQPDHIHLLPDVKVSERFASRRFSRYTGAR